MKKYTVAEAAVILIRNGIIRRDNSINKNRNGNSKFSTGEPQVRLWIREYSKVFDLEYTKSISIGEKVDKAEEFAHTKASRYGIKATMESRKIGYRIMEEDLFEFIAYKSGYKKENNIISKLITLKQTKSLEMRETKGDDFADGFEEGVKFALNYFENNIFWDKVLDDKEIIHLPKKGWFTDKNSIVAEHFSLSQLKHSTILSIDFTNIQMKKMHFSLKIINSHDFNSNNEIVIDWSIENAFLSGHFRGSLEKIINDESNIRIIKDILSEQIPQDDENRLAILLLLSE